jgi:hypothetical protein
MLLLPNELDHQNSTVLDRKGFSSPNKEICLKMAAFLLAFLPLELSRSLSFRGSAALLDKLWENGNPTLSNIKPGRQRAWLYPLTATRM